jgi:aromatase
VKPTKERAEHTVTIQASAEHLRRLLTGTGRWPVLFGPVVYVAPDRAATAGIPTALDLWTRHGDRVVHWTGSHRLAPSGLRLDFRYTAVGFPATGVSGRWTLEPLGPDSTRLTLRHQSPRGSAAAEALFGDLLADLRRHAELGDQLDALVFTFEDTVRTDGSVRHAYAFLREVQGWPGAVSHVAAVTLAEPVPDVQHVRTSVRSPDGAVTEIPSVRVCLPQDRVVYTPLTVPPFATAHLGEWIVGTAADGRTTVTGRHTVALDGDRISAAFGPGTTPADARRRVRAALGAHSLATLDAARVHAESHLASTAPTAAEPVSTAPDRG